MINHRLRGMIVFWREVWTCVVEGRLDVCLGVRGGRMLGREEWTYVGERGVDVC